MRAGFAKVDITPPIGTPLMGYSNPYKRVSTANNDPLYLRVAWFEDQGRQAVVVSFDFCFIGRDETERLCGIVGRELGLRPDQVMFAATHTHAAPASGTYVQLEFGPPLRDYNRFLHQAVLSGITQACRQSEPVRIKAAAGKSAIGMNRRRRNEQGKIVNGPNPDGRWHDSLPVALFESVETGLPMVFLFSASAHPVTMNKSLVSADYPGVACGLLDKHFGRECAIFLQGCGGDSRPAALRNGDVWNWGCTFEHAKAIGQQLANEAVNVLQSAEPVSPLVKTAMTQMHWPMQPAFTREEYAKWAGQIGQDGSPTDHANWARRWLTQIDNKGLIPTAVPVLLQGMQLGEGLRLIAMEGEPLSPLGFQMESFYAASGGTTFALGYANGEAIYLVSSPMLDEGGYEPESYWEYGWPAPLAKGMEKVLEQGLVELRASGVA